MIDLFYQHRVDINVPIEDTVGAMSELVKALAANKRLDWHVSTSTAQRDGLSAGLTQTFDGEHPCSACKVIQDGKKQEGKKAPLLQAELKRDYLTSWNRFQVHQGWVEARYATSAQHSESVASRACRAATAKRLRLRGRFQPLHTVRRIQFDLHAPPGELRGCTIAFHNSTDSMILFASPMVAASAVGTHSRLTRAV